MSEPTAADASLAEIHSELFLQLVTGHAQIAMMFLGRYPNPQTGQNEPPQPEAAKIYIDQLEMLQAKTRGNLSAPEARLLGELLDATRASFAQVIDAQVGAAAAAS